MQVNSISSISSAYTKPYLAKNTVFRGSSLGGAVHVVEKTAEAAAGAGAGTVALVGTAVLAGGTFAANKLDSVYRDLPNSQKDDFIDTYYAMANNWFL